MNEENSDLQDLSPEDRDFVIWVKKCFWFLVEQYSFVYAGQSYGHLIYFNSPKIRIEIEARRQTASTFFYKVGEPDFVFTSLYAVQEYYGDEVPEGPISNLEQYIKFLANQLEDNAPKIIHNIDEWWIPVQLFYYKQAEEDYKESDQLDDFLLAYKESYNYLKSKGALD